MGEEGTGAEVVKLRAILMQAWNAQGACPQGSMLSSLGGSGSGTQKV